MGHSNDCPCHACRLDNADSRLDVLESYLGGGGSQTNGSDAQLSGSISDLIKSESRAQAQAVLKENEVRLTSPALGHVYIQFRDQDSPITLYPGTLWENISPLYEGRFFRAEGGRAFLFGTQQSGGLPNITGYTSWGMGYNVGANPWGAFYLSGASLMGETSTDSDNRGLFFNATYSNTLYGAAPEVRPINETFRIWKRTA